MGAHLEREFKLPLPSEAHFAAVLERLRALGAELRAPVCQRNHFFDTAERALRRAHIALRLRAEDGRHELCLKGKPRTAGSTLAARPEEELALDDATARALLAGTRAPLAVFEQSPLRDGPLVRLARVLVGGAPLSLLGSFENERTRVGPVPLPRDPSATPLVFELDRTHFPGGHIERELEVELPPAADAARIEAALHASFADLGVTPRSVPSKEQRFF